MKQIFGEYGRTIVVTIAVIALFALLFIRLDFFDTLGTIADVGDVVVHDKSENAMSQINGKKPVVDLSGVNSHICKNQALQPMAEVVFQPAEGRTIVSVAITSILYSDAKQDTKELISYYNSTDDIIVINPAHYSDAHGKCTAAEFDVRNGKLVINNGDVQNCPGVVTVTYVATDSENQTTVERVVFVVDDKNLQA